MRHRCTLLAALAMASTLSAQAMKLERETASRANELRRELLHAWQRADAEGREAAAAACHGLSRTRPLGGLVGAVAAARGERLQALDDAAGDVLPFITPEVIDPAVYDAAFVTLRTTHAAGFHGPLRFRCRLRGPMGDVLQERTIEVGSADEMLRNDAKVSLPIGLLEPGRYTVEVARAKNDEHDAVRLPAITAPVTIAREFAERVDALPLYYTPFHPESKARAEHVDATLRAVAASLDTPAAQAAYVAALLRVDRFFRGEARIRRVDPLFELAAYDRVQANLANDRDPYAGFEGRTTIAVPLGDEVVRDDVAAFLRVSFVRVSVDLSADERRPLVVFLPGTPAWDGGTDRPIGERATAPEWIVDRLAVAGFDRGRAFHTAVIESVGQMKSPTRVIAAVTRALQQRLDVDAERIVWVGEREGAHCVGRAFTANPELARAAVLVGGGSFSNPELREMDGSRPVLLVASSGHDSTSFLERLAQRAAECDAPVRLAPGTAERPWPIAMSAAAREIEALVLSLPAPPTVR